MRLSMKLENNTTKDIQTINDSQDSNSYSSLRSLRDKRMSITRDSPHFGSLATQRDHYNATLMKYQKMNYSQDELENAYAGQNKMFQKRSSIFSFNKTENSSLASEVSPEKHPSTAKRVSNETNKSPQFLSPAISYTHSLEADKKRSKSLIQSSSGFLNQLPQIAELVKKKGNNSGYEPSPKIIGQSKRQSAFFQQSHLSISSIQTFNSVSKDENPHDSSSVKLNQVGGTTGQNNASKVSPKLYSVTGDKISSMKVTSTSKKYVTESKQSSGMVMMFNN